MSKPIEPLKRPPLLYHSVQDAIRNFISDNKLRPGDALPPENVMAQQLGVSRNLVREATRSLESLGVIETRRGTGLFVQDFSLDPILNNLQYSLLSDLNDLSDLLQIRRILETGMIGTAIATMPDSQKQGLKQVLARMRTLAEAGQTFPNEDREFHHLIFEFAGNSAFTKLLDIFWQTFHKASLHADIADTKPMLTYQAHESIVDAIVAMKVREAQVALDRHYSGIEKRLEQARLNRDEG